MTERAAALRSGEPDVTVCRSRLDPRVWFCLSADECAGDMTDWENPGGLRAVQRYAAGAHAGGLPVRWCREDVDTWRMRVVGPIPWGASES